MTYTYKYPHPAVTVDALVFYQSQSTTKVLLIKRKNEPFKNSWAIPGGFVDEDETLEKAVVRELQEETQIFGLKLEQFKAYSQPDRDPRGRTISVVFTCIINFMPNAKAADDAIDLDWFSIDNLPSMAFDHELVIKEARKIIPNL